MLLYLIFIMAAALAPNFHGHLIFRFIAGFFGSTSLSCAGGTVADLWNPAQKAYAFPAYAIPAFAGPVIGQIMGSYIPVTLGWRWLEWVMLIMEGTILAAVVLLQPETYGNHLLRWRASALRKETGDKRYKAPMEIHLESLGQRLLVAVYRPFLWSCTEPIIILLSLYMTIIYIVLFTFLEGYTFVFGETYGLTQGDDQYRLGRDARWHHCGRWYRPCCILLDHCRVPEDFSCPPRNPFMVCYVGRCSCRAAQSLLDGVDKPCKYSQKRDRIIQTADSVSRVSRFGHP